VHSIEATNCPTVTFSYNTTITPTIWGAYNGTITATFQQANFDSHNHNIATFKSTNHATISYADRTTFNCIVVYASSGLRGDSDKSSIHS
jgi:hypothetical protein